MTSNDVAELSASQLVELYRARQLSPVEVTRAALTQIDACNGAVNALCLVDEHAALAAARASERRWHQQSPCGRLDGIPTTIKDLVLARGWPTRRGSLATDPQAGLNEDAPATARLREHGAILLGKTTTSEFGWKCVTDSPLTGITRNPWDTGRTPGGSSGGAAVAAALGMGTLHLGTDGGGSIRIPASFSGVCGMKPSYGRVPHYPPAHTGNLLHVGTLTRTVTDAALMLSVISTPDARDWQALPADGRDYCQGLEDGVGGLRMAYCARPGNAPVTAEVAELVDRAVRFFVDLGAEVEAVELDLGEAARTFITLWHAAAGHLLAGFTDTQRRRVEPGLAAVAEQGERISLADYQEALDARNRLGYRMSLFHQQYDLLLTPTLPVPAFAAGQNVADPDTQHHWSEWTPFTYPFNLTQQPACSVPCGFTADGLPVGLQIVGARHADALVLRAARAYELVNPFQLPGAAHPA